ncbi:metalloregulator ArsR/SmtB family transcription factor [Devosia sp.]|uniref:ArsR/SmtB family transcription factor n=1 Tax=Devosia sp. TaxID=1871048 RepID=UPI001AC90872|nr:metalloregulator ArsR/SmtB family transcription factor [Devosia sp.]MBN9309237.1 winged helix-turn-helix transcriptional regulator [Devosia sp.]
MIKMQIERLAERAEEASQLLAAMANPKRLLILCNLLEGEMHVTELSERIELAQSPLSQHLSKLRAWGLVKTRRDGHQINYRLASNEVRELLQTLYDIYCQS